MLGRVAASGSELRSHRGRDPGALGDGRARRNTSVSQGDVARPAPAFSIRPPASAM